MRRFLHVLNGDSLANSFAESGLPGEFAVWAEALYEGPIPLDVGPEAWRQVRAHHYASMKGFGMTAENLDRLARWDAPIDRFREFDEVILWLEHDLFDQLLLIRHLDWFSRRDLGGTRLGLICIDRFPGVEPFRGLATLHPTRLASLFGKQEPITPEQFRLARSAWKAFGSPDPRAIEAIIAGDTAALPFLAASLRRHLAEFPSTRNGLSRAESDALEALREHPEKPGRVCGEWLKRNPDAWMGDSTFFRLLRTLGRGPKPLIEPVTPISLDEDDDLDFRRTEHRLTDLGRRVLAGEADRIAECGIDRHLGGVHLRGNAVAWRWDEYRRCLASEYL